MENAENRDKVAKSGDADRNAPQCLFAARLDRLPIGLVESLSGRQEPTRSWAAHMQGASGKAEPLSVLRLRRDQLDQRRDPRLLPDLRPLGEATRLLQDSQREREVVVFARPRAEDQARLPGALALECLSLSRSWSVSRTCMGQCDASPLEEDFQAVDKGAASSAGAVGDFVVLDWFR